MFADQPIELGITQLGSIHIYGAGVTEGSTCRYRVITLGPASDVRIVFRAAVASVDNYRRACVFAQGIEYIEA